MFGKISFQQRINAGMAIGMVILLVLATNRIDQNHFETTQETVEAVFNDRVVAQNYIYEMNNLIAGIELEVQTNGRSISDQGSIDVMYSLINSYRKTQLTREEGRLFNLLQEQVEELEQQLKAWNVKSSQAKEPLSEKLVKHINKINGNLDALATIQLEESKHLTSAARKSLSTTEIISWMEIGLLIVAGIALQFLIFYRERNKSVSQISMN